MYVVQKRQKTKRDVLPKLVLVAVLLFAGSMGIYFSFSFIRSRMLDAVPVDYGVLSEGIRVPAVSLMEAVDVVSPAAGTVRFSAAHGERVPAGKAIGRVDSVLTGVDGESKDYVIAAPGAGVLDLGVMDAEPVLSKEVVSQLSLEQVLSQAEYEEEKVVEAAKGQRVARVINNLSPAYLVVELPVDFWPGLAVADVLTVVGEDGAGQRAEVKRLEVSGGKRLVLLEVPQGVNTVESRIYLVLEGREFPGYILPEAALGRKGGQAGVFVLDENRVQWRPVEVVGRLNGQVAVDGLDAKMRVVRDYATISEKN